MAKVPPSTQHDNARVLFDELVAFSAEFEMLVRVVGLTAGYGVVHTAIA
jgi:hypothetical protein